MLIYFPHGAFIMREYQVAQSVERRTALTCDRRPEIRIGKLDDRIRLLLPSPIDLNFGLMRI